MTILIYVRRVGLLAQHYREVVRSLLEEQFEIVVVCEKRVKEHETAVLEAAFSTRGLTVEVADRSGDGAISDVLFRLRVLTDALRYRHPAYPRESDWLYRRVADEAPRGVRRLARALDRPGVALRALRFLLLIERTLPPVPSAVALIETISPDLVVALPGVAVGSRQVDMVKAAARRHIATAVWIPSWDNLTNKGLLRIAPDRVFVWNSAQARELQDHHDVPLRSIAVTGAQTFDHWFRTKPSIDREEYCRGLGLDPAAPFILYLGSSRSIAPDEPRFFERWLETLRSSDNPVLRDVEVLVRAHPRNIAAWYGRALHERPGVRLSVPTLDASMGEPFFEDYGAAFEHASIAVGINTSAMVEASIFGLPVCALTLPELGQSQSGTLHFRHLTTSGGGLLYLADSLEAHASQIATLLQRPMGSPDRRSGQFVAAFIRPQGENVPASELFVKEVRALVGAPSQVPMPGTLRSVVGWLLARTSVVWGALFADAPVAALAAVPMTEALVLLARARAFRETLRRLPAVRRVRRSRPVRRLRRLALRYLKHAALKRAWRRYRARVARSSSE